MSNLRLLNETSATSVSSMSITDVFSSDFDIYKITYTMSDASVGTAIDLRLINSSGSVVSSSDYDYARLLMYAHTSFVESKATNQTYMRGMGEATEQGNGNIFYLFNCFSSSSYTFGLGQSAGVTGTNNLNFKWIGVLKNTASIKGFNLFTADGTVLDTFEAKTYGLRVDT
jgi:hypothetical protein